MQYSIPLIINNRRQINAELFQKPLSAKSYIIEIANNDLNNIICINKLNVFKCFVENNFDIAFENLDVNTSLINNKVTIICTFKNNITTVDTTIESNKTTNSFYDDLQEIQNLKTENKSATNKSFEIENKIIGNLNSDIEISFKHTEIEFVINCQHKNIITQQLFENNDLEINIILQVNEQSFFYQSKFYLSHPSQFLGIALDFGSESSQMAVKRYEVSNVIYEDKPSIENLFQQIKLFYLNNNWIERNDVANYYQEDKGSNFFKSLFFLKEHLTGNYVDIDAEEFILEQKDNLKLLVDTNSLADLLSNTFYQLPNLKIIHKHNDILSSLGFEVERDGTIIALSLKEIKQKVNNSILKTMVESFLQKEFNRYPNATRYVRLQLLVPNIYDSHMVQYTQVQLNKILYQLSQQEKYKNKLLAWEVMTISESDASFIGYINRKNSIVNKNKDYIIIDVGKGTTDFSIIKTGENNIFDLESIYRNGFAGAGNLITNAIFETILKFIREENNGQSGVNNFIKTKVLDELKGKNLAMITKFYNEIERLKYNFKSENTTQLFKDWENIKSNDYNWQNIVTKEANFATIIDMISKMEYGLDIYGYVDDVCEAITEKVIAHLLLIKNNIKEFDCDGIILTGRGFLFEPLAKKIKNKLQDKMQIALDKIVLLNGSELKDICIKGVFNKTIQLNTDSLGHPIQIIKGNNITQIINTQKPKKNWLQFLVGSIENDNVNDKKVILKNNNIQLQGLENSHFIIGANAYQLGNKTMLDNFTNNKIATIDYTSTGNKVRRILNNKVEKIISLVPLFDFDDIELKLIIPSLFPNYINEQYLRCLQNDLIGTVKVSIDNQQNTDEKMQTNLNPLLFGAPENTPNKNNTNLNNDLLF